MLMHVYIHSERERARLTNNVFDIMSNGIYIRIFLKFINKILNIDKKIKQYRKKIIYSDRAFNSLPLYLE